MSMNAETKGEPCLSSAILLSCSLAYKPLHMNTKTSLPFRMKLRTASVSSAVSNDAIVCLYGQCVLPTHCSVTKLDILRLCYSRWLRR